MTLVERLAKIQADLKAPKGQENKFGGYKYRSCEDIVEAVKPLLGGLVLTISDEIVLIGDRYYVKATATLSGELGPVQDSVKLTDSITGANFVPKAEPISVSAFAREPESRKGMDEAQITGATSSYARKYALNGLFAIDDTKDADTMDRPPAKLTDKQVDEKVRDLPEWIRNEINAAMGDGTLTKDAVRKMAVRLNFDGAKIHSELVRVAKTSGEGGDK